MPHFALFRAFSIAIALPGASLAAAADMSISGGQPGGLYYPVAGALCSLVNEHAADHQLNCTVGYSAGSIANIQALRDGEADLAIVQSDTQSEAMTGSGAFASVGPFPGLRSVAALFVEDMAIASRKDKGIVGLDDLRGKRVSLGAPGSGGRAMMERLMEAAGWSARDVTDVPEGGYAAPNLAEALCDGELDAFVTTVGHPSPLITDAVSMCDVTLVPLAGPAVNGLVASNDFYAASVIPAGTYSGIGKDVPAIAVVATLVTIADVPPHDVYAVTRAFVEGYDRLRERSPLFGALSVEELASLGLSAPLHEGAARYYSEARNP